MTEAKPIVLRFVSTVSTRGAKELVVSIPKEHHEVARKLKKRSVKVIVEEIIV